jgi:hypothetical protein
MRSMLISERPHPGSEAWASLVGQKRLRGETKIDDSSRVPGTFHFVVVVKGKPQRHRNFSRVSCWRSSTSLEDKGKGLNDVANMIG